MDTNAPDPEVTEITADTDEADATPVGPDATPDVREDEVSDPDTDGGDSEEKP